MLKFLKKLLSPEQPVRIPEEELSNWFSQQVELQNNPLRNKFEELREKYYEGEANIKKNIDVLENAELKNPDISIKELQFMHGNREIYIKKASLFLESITFPQKIEDCGDFVTDFLKNLFEFSENTVRPYTILQEFFAHESRDIALEIKELENIAIEVKKVFEAYQKSSASDIMSKINSLKTTAERRLELVTQMRQRETELEDEKENLKKLESEKKALKEGAEHKEYKKIQAAIEDTNSKMKDKQMELAGNFSILEHALKKYARMSFEHEALCNRYLENPTQALLADQQLDILRILANMRDAISRDEVELKDRKKEKSLSTIEKMDRGYLLNFVLHYNGLIKAKKKLEQEERGMPTPHKLKEFDSRIEKSWERQAIIQRELTELEKNVKDVDVGRLKKQIEEEVSAFIQKEFSIG